MKLFNTLDESLQLLGQAQQPQVPFTLPPTKLLTLGSQTQHVHCAPIFAILLLAPKNGLP